MKLIYVVGLIIAYVLLVYLRQRFGERRAIDVLVDDFILLKNWAVEATEKGRETKEEMESNFEKHQENAAKSSSADLLHEIRQLKKKREETGGLDMDESMKARSYIDEYKARKK